ncbi:hypothetical protein GCM10009038_30330 [Salinicola rhizosphaerae]|uniref:EF-hand domain-containing protein n=2 Tax=Salinicola rhizosphaerae TaxID=1443141 RepID=A0ABQ3EBJ6_9GAMM|nr:hypothetical protein GCM10009038_30330 [Salinicola rhizosphaerae]
MLMGLSLVALPGAWAQDEGTTDGPNIVEQEGEPQAPANASQLDSESIEKSGGVGRANAGFTDGGAQTPVDQRPNALSFDQLDVNGDGVIDQDEATSAKQETMFQQLGDEQAGGVTRERFESAMGADTLKP